MDGVATRFTLPVGLHFVTMLAGGCWLPPLLAVVTACCFQPCVCRAAQPAAAMMFLNACRCALWPTRPAAIHRTAKPAAYPSYVCRCALWPTRPVVPAWRRVVTTRASNLWTWLVRGCSASSSRRCMIGSGCECGWACLERSPWLALGRSVTSGSCNGTRHLCCLLQAYSAPLPTIPREQWPKGEFTKRTCILLITDPAAENAGVHSLHCVRPRRSVHCICQRRRHAECVGD